MWDTHLAPSSSLRNLCLGTVLLLGGTGCLGAETAVRGVPVAIEMRPVALENGAPALSAEEAVRFLAGFELTSDEEDFGGFSGLECDQGDRLVAISDRGHWLSVQLGLDERGRLTSLSDGYMGPLLEPDGQAVTGRGRRDAEEVASLPGGGYLVTFEGEHRAVWYGSPKNGSKKDGDGVEASSVLATRPKVLVTPPGVYEGDDNAGFEAVTQLADGRLMLITEGLKDSAGQQVGWLSEAAIATGEAPPTYLPLRLHSVELFQPTAATTLPVGDPLAGDVLLLQRHYTPITGTRVRLFRLPSAELRPNAVVQPQELMRIEAPRSVDNFEGMAVCGRTQNGAVIYIISDDNFSAHQRTLLFQLELTHPDG